MTGRAKGKHTARTAQGVQDEAYLKNLPVNVDPDSLEGHKLGMSKMVQGAPSPIPGGKDHLINAPVYRQRPEAPAPADFTDQPDQNAHGVPPTSHNGATRGQIVRGRQAEQQGDDQYYAATRPQPRPVPVFVVENQDKTPVYRTASPRKVVVPINTADPIPLCGRDPDRVEVMLLNEDPSNGVRFAVRPSDLDNAGGSLLPPAMGNYLKLKTQDSLYAVSNTGTAATVSVIQVFDTSGTEL